MKTRQAVLDRINISVLHGRPKSLISDMLVTAPRLAFFVSVTQQPPLGPRPLVAEVF